MHVFPAFKYDLQHALQSQSTRVMFTTNLPRFVDSHRAVFGEADEGLKLSHAASQSYDL